VKLVEKLGLVTNLPRHRSAVSISPWREARIPLENRESWRTWLKNCFQCGQSDRALPARLIFVFSESLSKGTGHLLLVVLVIYTTARSLIHALTKTLWIDEILTKTISSQANVSAIWNALARGADGQPPLFFLIERIFSTLIGNEYIAYRLPSILGFSCTLICTFFFVKKRSSGIHALICTSVLVVTPLFTLYAADARPYSLVIASVSIALICYQQAPAARWMIGMGLSLAMALSLHYYAVFVLVPFAAAEVALSCRTKQLRLSVWLALFSALIPFGASWSLLMQNKKLMGAYYWSPSTLLGAASSYSTFLNVGFAWGVAVGGILFLVVLGSLVLRALPNDRAQYIERVPFHEHVLVAGLIGLPMIVFTVTKLAHGGMVDRYLLSVVLGIAISVSYVLSRFNRTGVLMVATLILLSFTAQEVLFWYAQLKIPFVPTARADYLARLVNSVPRKDLPVVVSDGVEYVEIWHVAPPEMKRRIVALVDLPNSIVFAGSDNVDKDLLVWRSYLPLQVSEFSSFASEHSVFLLYSNGSTRWDWWPNRLMHDGAILHLVAAQGRSSMYLVELKENLRQPHH
jgi:Dolichyl-phosphate-mannose-protein mannosyltransferase